MIKGLEKGLAQWRVEAGSAADFADATLQEQGTMILSEHFTSHFENSVMPTSSTLEGLPTQAEIGASVTLSGDSGPDGIRAQIFIGRPDGAVDIRLLGDDKVLWPDTEFSTDYVFEVEGLYVVELLAVNSIPIRVLPVYVGGSPPLER